MSRRRVRDVYPLTAMQRGMLVQALRAPGEPVYHQQHVMAITGVPDATAIRQGIADLVVRHTVLRTGFVWDGVDNPAQVVFADATVPLVVADARGSDASVALALAEQRAVPFDLRKPPLLRAHALRVGAAEWRLVVTTHHLVLDGWSMPIVRADLAELISARAAGRAPTLPPAAPFREFVTWLREHDNVEAAQAYFKRLLGDLHHPTPLGIDRVGRVSVESGPSDRVVVYRSCDQQPDVLARNRGLLPSTIAHAAWGLLLAGCAGTSDAVFGTTVSGRPAELPGVGERVGMFVNTVPVRVSVDDALAVGPWLADLQEQLIAGREFEQTPVSVAQRCSGVPLAEPLYESVLAFQNYFRDEPDVASGEVTVRAVEQQEQTGLPLVVSVAFPPGAIWVRVEYDRRRIDLPVAQWLADRYTRLLGELAAADDETALSQFSLLGPNEIRRTQPRTATRSLDALLADIEPLSKAVAAAAEQLRDAAGQRIAVWLPAPMDLVAVALGGMSLGADVTQVPADASATELVEHCRSVDVLVVPEGTRFAVAPPVSVVYFRQSESDAFGPAKLTGRWRGASADVLAEAVELLAALPLGGRVAVAWSVDEPALLPLVLASGACVEFLDPVIGVPELRDASGQVWQVYGVPATGGVYACGLRIPGAKLVDRFGRAVPDAVAGELVIACADGDVHTGVWARVLADGAIEHLGDRPGSQNMWIERQFGQDAAVARAVVDGDRTWFVPADGQRVDIEALLGRLRKVIPNALLPRDIRAIAGHVDRAALIGPSPSTPRPAARPLAARLALVPAQRRTTFLDHLRAAQRAEVMANGDGGTTEDEPSTVHALVVQQDPDSLALQAIDGQITYGQLLGRASALAAGLRARGIGLEDRVAVCLPRTSALVWAPLGIMMAGAAYVPIDPRYPRDRIAFQCTDAQVSAVITTEELAPGFPDGLTVLTPDSVPDAAPVPVEHARPDSAAYVIYTSGSTGRPKGVVVEHRSVVDFSRHIATAYSIDTSTRLLGFAALTFDVSVFDLWSALCAGATLVLADDEERLSVDRLQALLERERVTVAELPPSLMPLLHPEKLPDLRLVSVGGEAPSGALVDEWAGADREFWNGYGPAETTVAVTLMRCEPPSGGRVPPIGRPMPNHRVYVLDDQLRPVPVGVPGELCVAGVGLARGYLGRPGLTADRFVPDPFGDQPGERLYRTGDLVRWAPEGVLEFLGRVDRQVKIRGFRVELGEVESVLAADPRIRQVAVEVWAEHLTAYVVPAGPAPTLAEVREIAAARLPDYLTPTRLAVLAALPRTPSGKIDRRALPEPAAPGGVTAPDDAWTPLEREIATEVIGPLLRLSEVDREQDFFELGGNSLQATQVTSRIRDRFAVEVSLADFFVAPTVARLAALVEREQHRAAARENEVYAEAPTIMASGAVLPQSFPQQALYQAEQAAGPNARYNAPFALRMRGPLDLDALSRAFRSMVQRHPTLRVSLHRNGDDYVQRVLSSCDVPLEVSDVDDVDRLRQLVREEGAKPFDLVNGPLIRVRVHRIGPEDHVVQWTVHHLATDGWSVGIQLHEIGTAYHAFAEGAEPDLEPLAGNYAEFVDWHRAYVASPHYAKDLDWWRDQLRGASGIELPTRTVRPAHEFRPGYLNLRIEPDLAAEVHALGKRAGTSLYMTTLAAYATVLAAHSGRDDITVVTPNALRVRSAWERLIGWFVNRVVVRLSIDDSVSFGALLRATREVSTAAFAHNAVPFESMRAEIGLPDDVLAACFSVQNAPLAGKAFRSSEFEMELVGDDSGLDFTPIGEVYAPLGLRYETSIVLRQREDGAVAGGWEYDAGLFDEQTAQRWRAGLIAVLARGAANPDTPVGELRRIAADAPTVHSVRSRR